MKKCFKCGARKPLSEFYEHSRMADGHLNKCKACTKVDVKARYRERYNNDPEWRERQRARGREKHHRLYKGRKRRVFRAPPRNKKKAATAVGNAVRDGRMVKPTSCSCGRSDIPGREMHAHHEDYGDKYRVVWLCAKCHANVHYEIET